MAHANVQTGQRDYLSSRNNQIEIKGQKPIATGNVKPANKDSRVRNLVNRFQEQIISQGGTEKNHSAFPKAKQYQSSSTSEEKSSKVQFNEEKMFNDGQRMSQADEKFANRRKPISNYDANPSGQQHKLHITNQPQANDQQQINVIKNIDTNKPNKKERNLAIRFQDQLRTNQVEEARKEVVPHKITNTVDLSQKLKETDAEAQYKLGEKHYYGQGVTQSYKEAMEWFRKAADQGNGRAQYHLGLMFQNGWGTYKSNKEALEWYWKAAEQGHANAQYNLGAMYEKGWGVDKLYEEAVKWYRKAAEQGHADGQNRLGFMYMNGWGVDTSFEDAIVWYWQAAEQEHANAQYNLGLMYDSGWGTGKSFEEAVKWYTKAAEQGNIEAKNKLDMSSSVATTDIVTIVNDEEMTTEQQYESFSSNKRLEENDQQSIVIKKDDSTKGVTEVKNLINLFGEQLILNEVAEERKRPSVQQDKHDSNFGRQLEEADAEVLNNLGDIYYYGQGVNKSYEEAVKWYRKAAEQGHAEGQYNLGFMYQNGWGVDKSYDDTVLWYWQAAEQGNANAQYHLGLMYQNGWGVGKSYDEAVKWYRKAAVQGNAGGQVNLGFMYQNGWGVEKSHVEAVKWYTEAAVQEDEYAKERLLLLIGE